MRQFAFYTLILNVIVFLFIGLWLLVGGSGRGYFMGGAAAQVDGVLLLFLTLFNLAYLLVMYFLLAPPSAKEPGSGELAPELEASVDLLQPRIRPITKFALFANGLCLLFIGLWLLLDSGRGAYFVANATEVDVILLLFVIVCNLVLMSLLMLRFRR